MRSEPVNQYVGIGKRRTGIVLPLPSIAGLYQKVATVPIQSRPVQDEIIVGGIEINPIVRGHEPVLVVADEQIDRREVEEPPLQPSPARIRARTASNSSLCPSFLITTYSCGQVSR